VGVTVRADEQTAARLADIRYALDTPFKHEEDWIEARDHANMAADALVAELRRVTDALREAYTGLERASFDAHDREWSRGMMKRVRDLLAGSGDRDAGSPAHPEAEPDELEQAVRRFLGTAHGTDERREAIYGLENALGSASRPRVSSGGTDTDGAQ
jgi:hypothetical protein